MYKKEAHNIAIGLVLQELHAEAKLQREQIAEALEIPEMAVTQVEHGAQIMSAGSLILLLDLFDVSWDDFMRRVRANLEKAAGQIR